jgi:hypothetical protein
MSYRKMHKKQLPYSDTMKLFGMQTEMRNWRLFSRQLEVNTLAMTMTTSLMWDRPMFKY